VLPRKETALYRDKLCRKNHMDENKKMQAADEPVEFFTNTPPLAQPSDDSQTQTSDIPIAAPAKKPVGDEFKCPQCGKIFIVALKKRPLHIRCPYCNLEGMID
jgi:predicted RNA-binding Zn-ribbon protein involved in translation (DUF1610 family)